MNGDVSLVKTEGRSGFGIDEIFNKKYNSLVHLHDLMFGLDGAIVMITNTSIVALASNQHLKHPKIIIHN